MTATDRSNSSTSPREQALHWFSKMRLGTLTPEERRACDAWRAQDPEHERQYRSLEDLWTAADHLPMDEMRAIMESAGNDRPRPRRRFIIGAGAACASVLVAGVVARNAWMDPPHFTQRLATARGERRQFSLPDGSLLDLNTGTQVAVFLHGDRRVVELLRGEALFSVSPDAARPFMVDAGTARVLVTGTRFNVRRDDDRVAVAVTEGTVEFSAGPWWRRSVARLSAGYVSHASKGEGAVSPYRDQVDAIVAWQRGRLVFRDAPLSLVAAELNRYLARPLRLADTRVGQLRVSGTLGIDEPEAVLDILPQIAPVIVTRRSDGGAVLSRR